MKIAISARGLDVLAGGAKEYILEMVHGVPAADVKGEHQFYIYYSDKKHLGTAKAENVTEKYVPSPVIKSRFMWDHFFLPLQLKRDGINVALFPKYIRPLWCPCKSVVTVLDMAYYFPGLRAYKAGETKYMRAMMPRSLKRSEAILAISHNTKNDICELIDQDLADKIHVTHLAPARHVGLDYDGDVRSELGLGDEPYIFFSGSLSPRKNIQRVLEALAKVKHQIPHNFVVTAGKSWGDSDIPKLLEPLGLQERFIKLGYQEPEVLNAIYKEADLYLHPSLYEGFGMTALEAMVNECPVITSNNSSLPEVVGDAAIQVDPYDVNAIADAVVELATDNNLRQQLIAAGKERAKLFSWERSAKKTLEVMVDAGAS